MCLVLLSTVLTLGFWYKGMKFKTKNHYVSKLHMYSVATESFIFWSFLIQLRVMVFMVMFIM